LRTVGIGGAGAETQEIKVLFAREKKHRQNSVQNSFFLRIRTPQSSVHTQTMAWLHLDDPFELLAKAMGPEWEPGLESPLRTRPARWASALPSTDAAKAPETGVEEPVGVVGDSSEVGGRDVARTSSSAEEWEHEWLPCLRADGRRIFVHRLRLRKCGAMNSALLSFAEDEALVASSEQASNAGGGYHSDRSLHTRAAVQVLALPRSG
jgi:hypothetical protein